MAADLMQLVRAIQAGIDIDGDEHSDIDPSRITYWGWSLGSHYGMTLPGLQAAVAALL